MKDYKSILTQAFGVAPKTPGKPSAPKMPDLLTPEPAKQYLTRNSINRDQSVPPESMVMAQSLLWGDGNLPAQQGAPQKPPEAPPQKTLDIGTAPSLEQQQGWGKTNG